MTLKQKIHNIIEPRQENRLSSIYDSVMLIAIVIGIVPLMFREQNLLFWYLDILSGLCFIIDYLLRWYTCNLRSNKNSFWAYIVYPFTPMAIIDLLSILPTINLISPTFKLARLSRLLRF